MNNNDIKRQNDAAQQQFLNEEIQSHQQADNKVEVGNPNEEVTKTKRRLQIGWYGINRQELPYQGKLYPQDWNFEIKSATGKEIAYFSTIDSDDPISVMDGMNYIIRNCVRITSNNGPVNPNKIYEIDRIFFILKVRDLTMPERENGLYINEKCPFRCSDTENQIELTSSSIVYKELSDFAKKYIDPVLGGFTVKTKLLGDIHFTPSTIESAEAYKEYFVNLPQENRDTKFGVRFQYYISDEMLANAKTPDIAIKEAYQKFYDLSQEPKKFAIYMKIEQEIQPGIEDQIKYICPTCKKEVRTALRFPNGIQNIFLSSNISEEFL